MSALIFDGAFEGFTVRVVGTPGAPEFVAQDACDALGIKSARKQLARFDAQDKGVAICDTPGGPQSFLTVTEAGLYRLVFRSNKPEAERFRRWVFSEVLPAIRKTGSYAVATPEPPRLPEPLDPAAQLGLIDMAAGVLRRLCGGTLPDRDRLYMVDTVKNVVADATGSQVEAKVQEVTVSARARQRKIKLATGMASSVGRHLSRLYQERHGERAPQCDRYVDGAVRQVRVYTTDDVDLVDQAIDRVALRKAEPLPPLASQRVGRINGSATCGDVHA